MMHAISVIIIIVNGIRLSFEKPTEIPQYDFLSSNALDLQTNPYFTHPRTKGADMGIYIRSMVKTRKREVRNSTVRYSSKTAWKRVERCWLGNAIELCGFFLLVEYFPIAADADSQRLAYCYKYLTKTQQPKKWNDIEKKKHEIRMQEFVVDVFFLSNVRNRSNWHEHINRHSLKRILNLFLRRNLAVLLNSHEFWASLWHFQIHGLLHRIEQMPLHIDIIHSCA